MTILKPVNLCEKVSSKETILDLKAVDTKNRIIDIEIQVEYDSAFAKRSLYYWAQIYSQQLIIGPDYKELNPVLYINIFNITLFKELKSNHNCFMLKEIAQTEYTLTRDLELHFIELTKTGRTQESLEKWISIIVIPAYAGMTVRTNR